MSSDNQIKSGTLTAAGVAVNIPLGFDADYVKAVNITDGDEIFEWFRGMTAGHAIKTLGIVDNGTTGNAAVSRISSNGISTYAGVVGPSDESGTAKGITLGTAICENEKVIAWFAFRNR